MSSVRSRRENIGHLFLIRDWKMFTEDWQGVQIAEDEVLMYILCLRREIFKGGQQHRCRGVQSSSLNMGRDYSKGTEAEMDTCSEGVQLSCISCSGGTICAHCISVQMF